MDKIIFEHTKASRYAAQGGSPSGKEGYNIWVQYPNDDMVHFLGFSPIDKLEELVYYYQQQGDTVYLKDKS